MFRLAGFLNRRDHHRAHKLAYKNDSEYKRIDDIIKANTKPYSIPFYSDELGLGYDEQMYLLNTRSKYGRKKYHPEELLQRICNWISRKQLYSYKLAKRRYVTWPKQRKTRGFSDEDVWELHYYLAKVIADSVEELRNNLNSWPGDPMTVEEWEEILDKIVKGFRAANSMDELFSIRDAEERNKLEAELKTKFNTGMELLQKHWFHLWD